MSASFIRLGAACGIAVLLNGCALTRGIFTTLGPDFQAPSVQTQQWNPPPSPASPVLLAHGGSADALKQWWQQFNDPVLTDLLEAAQASSATLAQAAARIARARADSVAATASGTPVVDANAEVTRSAFSFGGPAQQRIQAQAGLQSNWEIDLFGGLARQRESARAQLDANLASWHEARVSIAAEVANTYVNYRYCEIQSELARADAASRAETAKLSAAAAGAGFQSPANAALAQASAADSSAALAQRQAACEITIKGLVALTAADEATLRKQLARPAGVPPQLPRPSRFAIDTVPARVLAQRPDLAVAEREVAVASAGIGVAEADRYPRLSLSGNITPSRFRPDGGSAINVTTWSIGPSLTLPLFDGGRRAANADAARAQYKAAEANYQAKARSAVREVEEAMVRLLSVNTRIADTRAAAAGYRQSLDATQTRQRVGLGSMIELEDARRTALAADGAVVALELEGVAAWIALYRAAGGGWDGRLEAAAQSTQ